MDENTPLISIVMPAFNAKRFVRESIQSVINQTYLNWELIIVDDNSTDETEHILREFQKFDSRIVIKKNTLHNNGAAYARNVALNIACGQFIAFLDSDDTWEKEKLQIQISTMLKNGYNVSHSAYTRVDEKGEALNVVSACEKVGYKEQLRGNKIGNLTGVYNRDSLCIFYQENIWHEDYEMWLRILKEADSIGIESSLANYRVYSNSLSSNKVKAARWHYDILCMQKGLSTISRFYYFLHYIFSAFSKRI